MNVKRIDFKTHILSIGLSGQIIKPTVRTEYLKNLNILHPKDGNPVVEKLMNDVVLTRKIPLDDGIETLKVIKEKARFLTKYIDACIEQLEAYKKMI